MTSKRMFKPDNLKSTDELDRLLRDAANQKMSPEERFEQRISWIYGQSPADSQVTKDEIRERLREWR